MSGFTPGPWGIRQGPDFAELHANGRGSPVALADDVANARLIAAAPDLYEALEGLIPCVGSPVPFPDAAERVRHAVAAIAKAAMTPDLISGVEK